MRTKYTEEDIKFLSEYYPKGDWETIFNRFPNLSKDKIYCVCNKRGISAQYRTRNKKEKSESYRLSVKNRKKWTDDEIKILKDNYNTIPICDIVALLQDRTYDSIVLKAQKLKLTSYNKTKQLYTDDDINYIRDNWDKMSDADIAANLNRTRRAIKAIRCSMSLFKRDKESLHYENMMKFLRGRIYEWKRKSMENCNYQCILTGSKNFEIHHIISFNVIVKNFIKDTGVIFKESFDDYTIDELEEISKIFVKYHSKYPLGVCIEKTLHEKFHEIYGDINDQSQLDDFILKYNERNILH